MLSPDLQYFLSVVEAGSITLAAERLGLSQPAVSKAIARLERQAGAALLQRTARGVALTPAGRVLHARAAQASVSLDDALQAARDVGGVHAGILKVGVTPANALFVSRALFPRLTTERPSATIKFTTAFGAELFDALYKQHLHLVVSPIPDSPPDRLRCEVLFEEGFALIHSQDHWLASKSHIDVEDLSACEAVAPARGEVARQVLEQAMASLGVRFPKVRVESNHLDTIWYVASTSDLITVMPTSMLSQELPKGLVSRPIPLNYLSRKVGLFLSEGEVSAMAERAIQLLKQAGQAMGPDAFPFDRSAIPVVPAR